MRCAGVMSSMSSHTMCLMRSLQDSLMAVSGAILITLVPLPLKKALVVPAHRDSLKFHLRFETRDLQSFMYYRRLRFLSLRGMLTTQQRGARKHTSA